MKRLAVLALLAFAAGFLVTVFFLNSRNKAPDTAGTPVSTRHEEEEPGAQTMPLRADLQQAIHEIP